MNPDINRADVADAWAELVASGAPVDTLPALVVTPKHTYCAVHDIGDIVYLKVRDEPVKGMVVGIIARPVGMDYIVVWGSGGPEIAHAEIELTAEREL